MKPDGEFGENAARLFKKMLRRGNSLNGTGPTFQDTMLHFSGVNLRTELNMTFAGKTVKLLAMGITHLDGNELVAGILRAPFLCVAADESMRHGEEKYPIFCCVLGCCSSGTMVGRLSRLCHERQNGGDTSSDLLRHHRRRLEVPAETSALR